MVEISTALVVLRGSGIPPSYVNPGLTANSCETKHRQFISLCSVSSSMEWGP